MRQMINQAQTPVQYLTNDKIKDMTRNVSPEDSLDTHPTQHKPYGSSRISSTTNNIFRDTTHD